jgi:hypothetical protein
MVSIRSVHRGPDTHPQLNPMRRRNQVISESAGERRDSELVIRPTVRRHRADDEYWNLWW